MKKIKDKYKVGDILKTHKGIIGVVTIKKGKGYSEKVPGLTDYQHLVYAFTLNPKPKSGTLTSWIPLDDVLKDNKVETIGSIYKNPELLPKEWEYRS